MPFNTIKCCKPFSSVRCSSKVRKLNENLIANLKAMNCRTPLDTSLSICDSCRLHLYEMKIDEQSYHPTTEPLPSSSGYGTHNPTTEPVPSTSGYGTHNPKTESQPSTSRYAMEEVPSDATIASSSSQDTISQEYSREHNIELFNKGISGINVSPISSTKLKYVNYPRRKYLNITDGVRKHIFGFQAEDALDLLKRKAEDFDEMILQLKEKFGAPECSREDQLRILSVLPKSWSNKTIMEQFNTHEYLVKQARRLVEGNGILAIPSEKIGHGLSEKVKTKVLQFYDNDQISRATPGLSDYVTVKKYGKRQHVQKRLMMLSLREAYNYFKTEGLDIGFS